MNLKLALGKKAAIVIIVMSISLTILTATISYNIYADTMDEHYRTLTQDVAQTASNVIDGDMVEEYADFVLSTYRDNLDALPNDEASAAAYFEKFAAIHDEDYFENYEMLEGIKEASNVLYLYITTVDVETKTGLYIFDIDDSEYACDPGYPDVLEESNWGIFDDPSIGFPPYILHSDFGWLSTAGVPIYNSSDEVVGYAMVDISMDDVMQDRYNFLILLLIVSVVATAILVALFIYVTNKAVVGPINRLAGAASLYVSDKEGEADGSLSAIQRLEIKTGDEIENLLNVMRQMEFDIASYIDNITNIAAEKERIGAELNVAQKIQADMLPRIFPTYSDVVAFDVHATMTPAKEVGGDFYDLFYVDENHFALVVADVSGKGVPASLFMVISKTIIKNQILSGKDIVSVFENVNAQLCENNDSEMFVTVWLGVIDLRTGTMKCVNAGHEYPILKRGDRYEVFKDKHGFVLAGFESSRYKEYEIQLNHGDELFVYTDGVPEATNADNELFGIERTVESLNKKESATQQERLTILKSDIDNFVGDAPQFDDITMLGFKYK